MAALPDDSLLLFRAQTKPDATNAGTPSAPMRATSPISDGGGKGAGTEQAPRVLGKPLAASSESDARNDSEKKGNGLWDTSQASPGTYAASGGSRGGSHTFERDGSASSALPRELALRLVVRDLETVAALSELADPLALEEFAGTALRIGVLALKQARGRIDADLVQREGEKILQGLQQQLHEHSHRLHDRLAGSLRDYFDPQNGSFHQRVAALVQRDGELEQILRRQVGQQDSELAKTLGSHLGTQSPLLKMLDPSGTEGVVGTLGRVVEEALAKQRERVLAEFSLDNKQGALSRLVDELSQNQGELQADLGKRLETVVKQFSLDEENSALNRLVQSVSHAQRTITSEFSLDNDGSALSRLAKLLDQTRTVIHGQLTLDDETSALARLRKELLALMHSQDSTNRLFQEEVKQAITQLAVRKQEMQRGTQHGLVFEDALCEILGRLALQQGDLFNRVGNTNGLIRNCKQGDAVWELGPESSAPGERIVIEAKQNRSYGLLDAREELRQARENRGAQLGLFVFSSKSAPAELEPVQRFGCDIFVVWDAEDASTDLYLKCALTVAKALCVQRKALSAGRQKDYEELTRAVLEVQKQTAELEKISKWAESIQKNGGEIVNRVRISRDSLERQIDRIREHVEELRAASDQPLG